MQGLKHRMCVSKVWSDKHVICRWNCCRAAMLALNAATEQSACCSWVGRVCIILFHSSLIHSLWWGSVLITSYWTQITYFPLATSVSFVLVQKGWGSYKLYLHSALLLFCYQAPQMLLFLPLQPPLHSHKVNCVNVYQKWVTLFGRISGSCWSSVYLQLSAPHRLLSPGCLSMHSYSPREVSLFYHDGR